MNDSTSRNPLVSGKNADKRKQDMFARLTQPAIQNTSPAYHLPAQTMQSSGQKQLIVVTLDKLRPYEGNPRRTKNPAFDEIKASIKSRGLDHAPNVTQRPGDDFYTIADGGNTRLQALNELFQETQDRRFWSIECVFKPWQGDDIDSELNMIIGHLAENDIRGELSFIEKALGIQRVKALYEEQLKETLSHRKLAEKLTDSGYPISHQLIARMEQCLVYLYPHMPNILLNGLGKPQIDKLLSIYRNASTSWDKHSLGIETLYGFDDVWMHALSPMDEDVTNFSITDLQDNLIGKMVEALNYQVSYDALKLEIDLEERKLQKLIEKQAEISQRASESEQHLQVHQQQLEEKLRAASKTKTAAEDDELSSNLSAPLQQEKATHQTKVDTDDEEDELNDLSIDDHAELSTLLPELGSSVETTQAIADHLAGFGLTTEAMRQEEAENNSLSFANVGRQPISNLWKIFPNRQHKMDAYSIALDIAEECGIAHLVEHVVYEPVDYSFRMKPLDIEQPSPLVDTIYQLLVVLSTDQIQMNALLPQVTVPTELLLGSGSHPAEISDLLLVRLFRLIRLVRYMKEQLNQGEHHA